jgi:uncharacterized protein (TIGR00725 family)
MGMKRYVAVCGPGLASLEEAALAEEIGRLLAREGAVVVCGGLGGVMEAAAQGAASEGGVAVGILPGTDRTGQASALAFSIPTGMWEARNAIVVRAADALIAVGGAFGTLSEIALALKTGVPVVGLGTWAWRGRENPSRRSRRLPIRPRRSEWPSPWRPAPREIAPLR